MASAQDLLTACEAALLKCMVSQEYYVGGRRQRMADIDKLTKLRDHLKQEVLAESGGDSMTSIGVYGGPT